MIRMMTTWMDGINFEQRLFLKCMLIINIFKLHYRILSANKFLYYKTKPLIMKISSQQSFKIYKEKIEAIEN